MAIRLGERVMIVIVAGGTGGHLFPSQALAEELLAESIPVAFLGNRLSQNRYFLRDRFPFENIPSAPLSWAKPHLLPKNLWILMKGFVKARRTLRKWQPTLLVSFGSFHTFPVLLAGLTLGIPFILFEGDSIPGTVTRFFARFAYKVAAHFPSLSVAGKTYCTPLPLRKELQKGSVSREEACLRYGFLPQYPVLLILGGSQGAKAINEKILSLLLASRWPCPEVRQVLHLTGRDEDVEPLQKAYEKAGIKSWVAPFESSMQYAWSAADLAWCRAGASTLAEAIEYEIPGLLIPFPFAKKRHQHRNAEFFSLRVRGGFLLDESQLSSSQFFSFAEALWNERKVLQESIQQYKKERSKISLSALVKELWLKKQGSITS